MSPMRPGAMRSSGSGVERKGALDHPGDEPRVAVELYWEAAYRLGRGPWHELGYFRTFASRPYPVREVVTRLVFSEH